MLHKTTPSTSIRTSLGLILMLGLASGILPLTPTHTGSERASVRPSFEPIHPSSGSPSGARSSRASGQASERSRRLLAELPMSFEANYGQAGAGVKFVSRSSGHLVFISTDEVVLGSPVADFESRNHTLRDYMPVSQTARSEDSKSVIGNLGAGPLRMKLMGANSRAGIEGLDRLPGKSNYFIGSDAAKWRTNIPTYAKVKCRQVYPGVDLVYYGAGRELEYDFIVAPGADPGIIRLAIDGALRTQAGAGGDLVLETAAGEIRQHKPRVYQELGNATLEIEGRYAIKEDGQISFEIPEYDPTRRLIIDPVLTYSTYLGGSGVDQASAIAVDQAGNIYVAGQTDSVDFPTVNPVQPAKRASEDAFVLKLNAAGGALLFSTYIGGSRNDAANGVAIDLEGNVYITGATTSMDLPTTPGVLKGSSPDLSGEDGFVTKLNPNGNVLVYSTLLGGSTGRNSLYGGYDAANAIAVDSEGMAYVTGLTTSVDFPVRRAVQPVINKGSAGICGYGPFAYTCEDAFVSKLNPTGTNVVFSTYLGGSDSDIGAAIALDLSGNIYVTGSTLSSDFPTVNALQPVFGGTYSDAFLVKMKPSGREMVYATYLGGAGFDQGLGVAVDPSGNAYVAGETSSLGFPTTPSAFQTTAGGGPVFRSVDRAGSWQLASSGLGNVTILALAADPADPNIVYAGTSEFLAPHSVYKSTDGGTSWKGIGLANYIVNSLAVAPGTGTVFAGTSAAVRRSTDGGDSWQQTEGIQYPVTSVAVDPDVPTTVYAATGGFIGDFGAPRMVFKSTDSGSTWTATGPTFLDPITTIAIDPLNPSTIFVDSLPFIRPFTARLSKSTDGGETWSGLGLSGATINAIAIDPTSSLTIYAGGSPEGTNARGDPIPVVNIFKSTDGGATWSSKNIGATAVNQRVPIGTLVIDPANPDTLYAGGGVRYAGGGALFKSTDAGDTWSLTSLAGISILALATGPSPSGTVQDPSRLYAGTVRDLDGFVTKVSPSGSMVYSTYLGAVGADRCSGIGVDAVGNAYVAGLTFSAGFPTRDALQAAKPSGPFSTSGFLAKLNTVGSEPSYSTYLGGAESDEVTGIAVAPSGSVYLAGTTRSDSFPLLHPVQAGYRGVGDAFVARFAAAPLILAAAVQGKKLLVSGEGFDAGAVILLNGEPQKTVNDKANPGVLLIARRSGKNISRGQMVRIRVRNPDGTTTQEFPFTRPAE